ncbi:MULTISPECIES: TonB-dependent receptor [unclassified Colwellia]|uniref:TonB-dependent receptor n=1 Tax=unclassified Colwellia TaxID=196834 RepID=UPI0021754740|nr:MULTISPECIES: TonB-dependent receptor plug domain-containing protein [unclassified Colwellia]
MTLAIASCHDPSVPPSKFFEVIIFSYLRNIFVPLLIAMPVFAQVEDVSTDDIEVIEVVNDQSFNTPNYQVLHRESFIYSSQTLADILQSINGIQIRQISGIGNPVSVSIRGSSSKQVQLYIDGQLINDSQFGGFDLNQIPTEQIESIEISKNQAIGTGATPIGGVIRINTYNPTEDSSKLTLATGSFGYQEVNALYNKAFKTHSLSFGGHYINSDNDYDFIVPAGFSSSDTSDRQALRNNEFTKKSFFINDIFQFNQHQIRVNVQYNDQEKALPNYQNNSPENNSTLNSDNLRYSYQHQWLSKSPWLNSIEFEAYAENKDERYISSPDSIKLDINDYETTKKHIGFKPYLTWNEFNLVPFVSFNKQNFSSVSEHNGKPTQCNGIASCDISAKQEQLNIGSRIEWQPESLPIEVYALLSNLQEKNSNIAINQSSAAKFVANDNYQTTEVGLSFKQGNLKVTSNLSNGVRTPTLYELFGDRGSFKGNDNLLPEEAKTLSMGGQYLYKSLSISSSIYQQKLENSIVAIFNSSNVGSYRNVSNADLLGIEIQTNYQLLTQLSFALQANIIDSETTSKFVAFNKKKLPGIYHQQYSVALKYKVNSAWNMSFKVSKDKDLYFNLINRIENNNGHVGNGNPANRTVSDFSVNWKKGKHRISFAANNLFNDKYQDLANRTSQGRSLKIKYTIKGF